MIKNNKGVTLVELLIVIVILGIIAAVSIPAVGNIVENSQKDAVISEAASIRSAINTCLASGDCTTDSFITDETTAMAEYTSSDNEFVYDPSTQVIGVIVGEYYFIGNPSSASRDNVVEVEAITDVIVATGTDPIVYTFSPELDSTSELDANITPVS
ncbi:MAG: prepilin-type N-terminal cleavage/methylation domain-containing protein [Candidatus Izemoplasmataceae bacterium]